MDSSIKTPYSYTIDLSVARELRNGFSLEVAYVGLLSHRLLTSEDLAQPLNFRDKASGTDYFTAVQALAKLYRPTSAGGQGVTDATFSNSMVSPAVAKYWTDVLQAPTNGGSYQLGGLTGGCGSGGPGSTTSPVLAAFDLFCGGNFNETTPLQFLIVREYLTQREIPLAARPGIHRVPTPQSAGHLRSTRLNMLRYTRGVRWGWRTTTPCK